MPERPKRPDVVVFNREGKPVTLPARPEFPDEIKIPLTADEKTQTFFTEPVIDSGPEITQQIPALAPEEAVLVDDTVPIGKAPAVSTAYKPTDDDYKIFEDLTPTTNKKEPRGPKPIGIPDPFSAPLNPGELELQRPRRSEPTRPPRAPEKPKGFISFLKGLIKAGK